MLSTLVKSTIINGANTLAVALRENIVYRLQPVEVMIPVVFHNFKKDETKIIHLSDELSEDYKIVGITVDFPSDDDEAIDAELGNSGRDYVRTDVRIINKNKASENLTFYLNNYPPITNSLYINHNDIWKIKTNQDITKITFRCVPAIIENTINFN